MAIIEKEYGVSKVNFDALQKYLKENKNLKYVDRFVPASSLVSLGMGISSDIYHYLDCTLIVTQIDSFEDAPTGKLSEIELKVVSDTDSQSKKIFDELERILLNGLKNGR